MSITRFPSEQPVLGDEEQQIEDAVERGHGEHVDDHDVGLASSDDASIMRLPRPGTPKISAATTAIQAWPSAVRRPTEDARHRGRQVDLEQLLEGAAKAERLRHFEEVAVDAPHRAVRREEHDPEHRHGDDEDGGLGR